MRLITVSAAFFLGFLVFASAASATIILAMDMRELVQRADVVIVGTVERQTSHWDGRGRIVTDVHVRIDTTMKGTAAPDSMIVLRSLGGSIGEIGMRIAGEPSFTVGDRAVFFLRESGGVLRPVGMSQGVMAVIEQTAGPMVLPGGAGMSLVQPVANGRLAEAPPALMHPRPLDEVVTDIRRLVAATSQP